MLLSERIMIRIFWNILRLQGTSQFFLQFHIEEDQLHYDEKGWEEIWNIDWNIIKYSWRNSRYRIWHVIFIAKMFLYFVGSVL